jgi:lipoprotein-releasing system permease protein
MTPLGFEWRVAWRFLREGRMQTVLIVIGVAAGVAVIAYISALISGLQGNTLAKTLGAQAHVSISAPEDVVTPAMAVPGNQRAVTDTQPRAQRLRSVANWQAVLPLLEAHPAWRRCRPWSRVRPRAARRSQPGDRAAGRGAGPLRPHRRPALQGGRRRGAACGRARRSSAASWRTTWACVPAIRFTVQTGSVSDAMRVTAVVDLGVKDLNRAGDRPLRAAQNMLGLPGGATSLDLGLRDVWNAQVLADELRSQLPYKVESWQESNVQLVTALHAQTISTLLIRVVVVIVVVLGIASVMVVSVVQKQREIGILRAMAPRAARCCGCSCAGGRSWAPWLGAGACCWPGTMIYLFTTSCAAATGSRCS